MAKNLLGGKASLADRALSRILARWRGQASLSLAELQTRTGFSTAKLSTLCSARLRPSALDVIKIGYACDADSDEFDLAIRAAQRACDPETWDRVNGTHWPLPTWTYWDVASEATELVIVAATVLPELVRTPALHEAMLHRGATTHELTPDLKDTLTTRLDNASLRVHLIVGEPALTGNSRLITDQLRYLEELTELPGFQLSVIPTDTHHHFGMGTSFTTMRFVERRFDDVVHHRALHGDTWLETTTERAPYEHALHAVTAVARGPQATAQWLDHTATEAENQQTNYHNEPSRSSAAPNACAPRNTPVSVSDWPSCTASCAPTTEPSTSPHRSPAASS